MVGLSVVLEGHHHHKSGGHVNKKINNNHQVISKASMSPIQYSAKLFSRSSPPSSATRFPPPAFLEKCFLCKIKLLPGKDIYMYKGDRAFCSVECRCRQIFMDDQEETLRKENCSMAAIKPAAAASPSPSSPSSPAEPRHRRGARSHHAAAAGFAY